MSALDSTLILLLRRERSDRERKPEEMVWGGGHGDWGAVERIKGGARVRESGNSIITVPWQ